MQFNKVSFLVLFVLCFTSCKQKNNKLNISENELNQNDCILDTNRIKYADILIFNFDSSKYKIVTKDVIDSKNDSSFNNHFSQDSVDGTVRRIAYIRIPILRSDLDSLLYIFRPIDDKNVSKKAFREPKGSEFKILFSGNGHVGRNFIELDFFTNSITFYPNSCLISFSNEKKKLKEVEMILRKYGIQIKR